MTQLNQRLPSITVVHELPDHMQRQRNDRGIRSITVEAAHYATEVPLLVGQVLDRMVGAADTGFEK